MWILVLVLLHWYLKLQNLSIRYWCPILVPMLTLNLVIAPIYIEPSKSSHLESHFGIYFSKNPLSSNLFVTLILILTTNLVMMLLYVAPFESSYYTVILILWTPKYVCWSLIGCFSNNLIMSPLYITTYESSYEDCNLISWSPKSVHRWFDIWYLELVYPLLEGSVFYNILI